MRNSTSSILDGRRAAKMLSSVNEDGANGPKTQCASLISKPLHQVFGYDDVGEFIRAVESGSARSGSLIGSAGWRPYKLEYAISHMDECRNDEAFADVLGYSIDGVVFQ